MKIYIAGDSTFQNNDATTFPQTGIGQVLPMFFHCENIIVPEDELLESQRQLETLTFVNCAKNGRSTKSFIAEKRLEYIEKRIEKGDFLFVVFGHNDEKLQDESRGTLPFGEYTENLEKMAKVATKVGAFPLFLTPISRRNLDQTHGEYPKAMQDFCKKNNFPCIDLTSITTNILQNLDDEKSKKLYMNFDAGLYPNFPDGREDNTHLRPEGAFLYASIIIGELKIIIEKKLFPELNKLLPYIKKLDNCIRPKQEVGGVEI